MALFGKKNKIDIIEDDEPEFISKKSAIIETAEDMEYLNRIAQKLSPAEKAEEETEAKASIHVMDKIVRHGVSLVSVSADSTVDLTHGRIIMNYQRVGNSKKECHVIFQRKSSVKITGTLNLCPDTVLLVARGVFSAKNVTVNSGTHIECRKKISIGDGTVISRNVCIMDHDYYRVFDAGGKQINTPSPISIGKHVLIGHGAVIMKGVTIGDGAVIGAGSIVTSDIPPKCMAVGNPCKVIREDISWK